MKKRFIEQRLKKLFKAFPMVLLTGARQAGKTTLLNTLVPKGTTITFDPVTDVRGARKDPDLFLQNETPPAFLDEVQYVPGVLASLKRYVDSKPGKKSLFYLSGSQNLNVLKEASDSLAGRIAVADLYTLSYRELAGLPETGFLEDLVSGDKRDTIEPPNGIPGTHRLMWRGFFPGTLEMPDELLADYFSSYLRTYIERDIRTMADIQDISRFGRFVRLLSALSAQEINANQLGRELDIDRTTALRWETLCEASYQWVKIPAFSRNSVKRISGKSKGYFTDTGFLCALQGILSPQVLSSHPMVGHIFETFIVMDIIKRISAWMQRPNLYHFRAYSGAEVDLILEYNGKLYPIEIKLTASPTANDTDGIKAFKESFPKESIGNGTVVCCTPQVFQLGAGIRAVPWWTL